MGTETPPRRNLDEGVTELTRGLAKYPRIKAVLRQTAMKATKARSCYYKAINASIDLDPKERWIAHELVNAEYNRVVAHSLQAVPNLVASSADVGNILQHYGDDPLAIQRQVTPAPEYTGQLEGLTWERLVAILDYLDPPEDESREQRKDRARLLSKEICSAGKVVYDSQSKRGMRFILKEAAIKTVTAAAPAIAGAAMVAAHASTAIPWSFLLPPAFLASSWPIAAILIEAYTGHKPSIDAVFREQLTKLGVDGKSTEIINIVNHHPEFPHLRKA